MSIEEIKESILLEQLLIFPNEFVTYLEKKTGETLTTII